MGLYRRAVALTREGFACGFEHDSVLRPAGETAMAARGLAIRMDVASAPELRRRAKKEPRRRTAQRMLAIANALDGMSRADAARAAGIERQSLRDAVVRFNVEGLAGLVDRPHGHRPEVLSEGEQAVLVYRVLHGPDPERGEPSSL